MDIDDIVAGICCAWPGRKHCLSEVELSDEET